MEFMQWAVQFGLVILGIVVGSLSILVGLPIWLHHRRSVLKMTGQRGRDIEALHKRIDQLEKECRKLQDQVTEAHVLLADERRDLDKRLEDKLKNIVPDSAAFPDPSASDERSRSDRRARERE
ncbi:MAG TPA: hypothetical protein VEJ63_04360 [Planctomycetota bacterium]|nr:hypothetical protein [Planctomycetota bacterium]